MLHPESVVLEQLPDMINCGLLCCPLTDACMLTSIDSSGSIFMYCTMGSLLLHLQSMYIVSGASDLPNSALMHLNGLVGPFCGIDTSRL